MDSQNDRSRFNKSKNGITIEVFFLILENINYELADHCVTLKKSGVLHQVESLRSMNYNSQFSSTTEETLKHLPRSASEEIFDRVK